MFEIAELGRNISKSEYEKELPDLRARLLQAQFALKQTRHSVIIIVSGVDGAGKGEVVHRLNEWLDPRGTDTHAFEPLSEEEKEFPAYWSFWRALPARGRLGVLFGSWYTDPIMKRVYGKIRPAELDRELERITFFERTLALDGAVFVKLWFHLSKDAQYKRLKDLEKSPRDHWRVMPTDWKHHQLYDKFSAASERAIRQTDFNLAPWHIIEAANARYRDVATARILLETLERITSRPAGSALRRVAVPPKHRNSSANVLAKVDLDQSIPEKRYRNKLAKYQAKLNRLIWAAHDKRIPGVIVFEGWDAAGKGSCIRRVTEAMDPRFYRLIPIAAPTHEEHAQHYLWRFWRHLPKAGRFTIFDRSWYGRVLVERIEGFARKDEWLRAYREINDFEEQLSEHGIVLGKFWLHISKEEQLLRFRQREQVAYKKHKITDEDWRNRRKWDDYELAVNDMVARTSTSYSPWSLIPANHKRFARIEVLMTLCERLEMAL